MISPAPPRFAFRLRRFGGTKGGKARPFRANLFPVRPQRPSGCRHPRNPHNLKFLNGRSGKTPHFSAFFTTFPKTKGRISPVLFFYPPSEILRSSCNPSLLTWIPAVAGIHVGHRRRVRQDTPARRPQTEPRPPAPCLRAFPTAPLSAARHAHGSRSPAAAATPQGGTRGDRGKLFPPAGRGAEPHIPKTPACVISG